jgi:hypothetical protein
MEKAARWGLVLLFVFCSVRFVAGFLSDLSGPTGGSIFLCLPIIGIPAAQGHRRGSHAGPPNGLLACGTGPSWARPHPAGIR